MQPAHVRAEQAAAQHFAAGFYCAESVVLAIAETLQVSSDAVPRAATGFCSGLARTCGPCGALTGAVMGIGLVLGRDRRTDSVSASYWATQQLVREFVGAFGATNCQELLGCDLGTDEGQATFRSQRLGERCAMYTRRAAGMATRLLAHDHRRPIEVLSSADTAAVGTLLESCNLAATDIISSRPIAFFGYRSEQGLVGTIGLELFGSVALLRSLAVAPEHRNRGLAGELIEFAEIHARENGASTLYLLTTSAADFFVRHCYVPARRDQAPDAIVRTAQFSALCPASSTFMMKQLAGR